MGKNDLCQTPGCGHTEIMHNLGRCSARVWVHGPGGLERCSCNSYIPETVDAPVDEQCGGRWKCVLPKGHNMGSPDIPEKHPARKPYREPWVAPRRGGYAPEPGGDANPQPPEGAASVALRDMNVKNRQQVVEEANAAWLDFEFIAPQWVLDSRGSYAGFAAGYLMAKGFTP